ncbi:MAG: DUF6516 family protein [Candidatus Scalindua sp.]
MTSRDKIYSRLSQLAIGKFADIINGTKIVEGKLRILLKDESYIDVWLSVKKKGAYAYHWERKDVDGTIYRYNNLPDKEAKKLKTYPHHFHNKSEENIVESNLSNNPEEAVRDLLEFARSVIKK